MKSPLCKTPDCLKKKYGSSNWCFQHFRERARDKKEEKAARKKLRREGSKAFIEKQRKPLKKKLDTAFSLLIRSTGKCARCGRGPSEVLLTCSHIYSRRHLNVRWDPLNAKCLCLGCHQWWGHNPAEAMDWVRGIRTPEQLDELRRRVNTVKQWTVEELKQLLSELNEKIV